MLLELSVSSRSQLSVFSENLWGLLESDGKWGERGEEEVEKEEDEAKREERRGRRKKCKASCQGGRMKSPIRNHLLSPLP